MFNTKLDSTPKPDVDAEYAAYLASKPTRRQLLEARRSGLPTPKPVEFDRSKFKPARQVIRYVNAIPGSGKTHTFIHEVAVPHVQNNHNSLLIYAAPTNALLDEVAKALKAAGVSRKRILRIQSQDSEHNVTEDFRNVVLGKAGQSGEPNGNIILCTHECIAKAPKDTRGKERVVLVYDEARACLQDTFVLNLPLAVYKFLTLSPEHRPEGNVGSDALLILNPVYGLEDNDSDRVYRLTWCHTSVPLPALADVADLLPSGKTRSHRAQNILDFLKNVRDSSIDVYVSIKQVSGKSEYQVSNVFSPKRMFEGYGKVLILSAFFESSQMFHFLKMPPLVGAVRTPVDHTKLVDVSAKFINTSRMLALFARQRRVYITYLFENSVTKTELLSGIVTEKSVSPKVRKKINVKWSSLFDKRPESFQAVFRSYQQDSSTRSMADDRRMPALSVMRKIDNAFNIRGTVVNHMVKQAVRLQRAFMKKFDIDHEPLPIGVNQRSGVHDATVWKQEELDKFNAAKPRILQLPITAHGLNQYSRYHSCAFLATMKYSPRETTFLQRTVPDYNPALDRTLDYALQLLWRCNVRHPTKAPVLLIVTDRVLAKSLQQRFRKLAATWMNDEDTMNLLRVISPTKLVDNVEGTILKFETPVDMEKQKKNQDRWRNTVKGEVFKKLQAVYAQSPSGRAYIAIGKQIQRARKADKNVDALVAQRSKELTFSQWKKSPDGITAVKSLNGVQHKGIE